MYRPDLSEQAIKSRAKVIADLIKQETGHDLAHGQCLKIVSQLFGFENWNTAKAMIHREPKSQILKVLEGDDRVEPQILEAQTTGEVIEILKQVPPETKIRVYEEIVKLREVLGNKFRIRLGNTVLDRRRVHGL
jgi:hypothetical protein